MPTLIVIMLSFLFQLTLSVVAAYNTSAGFVPGKLNVHLVPHSHDDVGWLKTVDQYYVGSNNTIQGACVQNVLDSLIPALLADKNRKFIFVEQAFFQRWWRHQTPAIQSTVNHLVQSGQLEFINGGMCMHDEATAHYIDMIDQTTLGHWYLKEQFNVTPRIGWQIDPFGHSAVQAYLLGAELGFDSLFFARIDYQDRAKRKVDKTLELVWQASKTFGSSAQIFTVTFPENYEPPTSNFYFEVDSESPLVQATKIKENHIGATKSGKEGLGIRPAYFLFLKSLSSIALEDGKRFVPFFTLKQDDINLFDYNVPDRINDFVSTAISQANITRTNHIMWTMGTDFNYQYAHTWFKQMDKFIHYVNQDGRVNALYSTPSIYTDAKYAADEYWPVKTDDYFPYADRENAYWTGYFTSRPALKGYARMMSSYYLAARQLEFFKGKSKSGPKTDSLADALALAQHHDAITGTEKQHVANDYAKRLSIGYKEAEKLVATSLFCLSQLSSTGEYQIPSSQFQQCPLLNISYCPASEVDLSDGKSLVVVVYNPLGWKREDVIRIPVVNEDIFVQDSTGEKVESQLLPVIDASLSFRNYHAMAYLGVSPNKMPTHWLAFSATVPPLGFNTYIISSDKGGDAAAKSGRQIIYKHGQNTTVEVGPGNLKLIYTAHDGKLARYINTRTSVEEVLEQSYGFYTGNDGSVDYQDDDAWKGLIELQSYLSKASGAYVFRPNLTHLIRPEWQVPTTVLRGPLLDEIHQKINSWIYQVTRAYKGREHAEVEFIIGPIPVDDRIGKEVMTQITTAIQNDKKFYTDSNGRDFIERTRDYRKDWKLQVNQPVAGNYYPINLGIFMKDNTRELSVLVDRAVGGSSIRDGQLELMLHRRLLHDDSRGVDEALNEIICVQDECTGLTIEGKYYLRIDPLGEGAKWRRSFGQEIYSPMLLAFTLQDKNDWTMSHLKTFSGIDPSYHLPENVAIITLQELENEKVLLRLAHLYEIGEDKDLSVMATVELGKLFPKKKISTVTETSLSANQERAEMEKKRLVWKVEGNPKGGKILRGGPVNLEKLVVELAPMEIRTFLVDFTGK